MQSFVVDLYFEGITQEEGFIGMNAKDYYQHDFYPNGKLVIGSKSAKT